MRTYDPGRVTQLLENRGDGLREVLDKPDPLAYAELRQLSRHYLSRQPENRTSQVIDLINKALVRLIHQDGIGWEDRAHVEVAPAMVERQRATTKLWLRREIGRSSKR